MGQKQSSAYCKQCDAQRLHTKTGVNHVLHLILVIVLGVLTAPIFAVGGLLWLAVWVFLAFSSGTQAGRCTVCGEQPASVMDKAFNVVIIVGLLIAIGAWIMRPALYVNDKTTPQVTDLTLESTGKPEAK